MVSGDWGASPLKRARTLREPFGTMESDVDLSVNRTINRLLLTEVFILDQRYLRLYTPRLRVSFPKGNFP